ncbi:MAG TPA: ABC transporter ATP-binding protein [Gemmatimonadales bacterium]|nr:ABC transporter ATP-binding protein [Gemmatimonadales bacterium]
MNVASVRDLHFRYGEREAIAGASFDVAPGEGVALLGPNGAGKTTLLRLLMAFLHPRSGSVEVAGRSTAGLFPEDLAGAVGYLFQRPEDQLFRRTVREDARFGPETLGWDAARADAAVDAALHELGLADVAHLHPYDLPLPKRRLVALAGVLALEPKLLLLDEPTAILDRSARALVVRALRARRERGTAVIAVTHDTGFAAELCDRALALEAGRVAADGPIAGVLGRPGSVPLPAGAELVRRVGATARSLRWDDLVTALASRCRELRE